MRQQPHSQLLLAAFSHTRTGLYLECSGRGCNGRPGVPSPPILSLPFPIPPHLPSLRSRGCYCRKHIWLFLLHGAVAKRDRIVISVETTDKIITNCDSNILIRTFNTYVGHLLEYSSVIWSIVISQYQAWYSWSTRLNKYALCKQIACTWFRSEEYRRLELYNVHNSLLDDLFDSDKSDL